ncbi:hypothetical protein [Hymenobacter cheonanensis]|uniref:hypothetical protein n=1 Tax=Hymenobacter sp. CA2-7 TaxID=3063993 RepID=UPI002712C865|nr:hypothetical protein [Hymenobacter sp. CA2-7]MDO7886300.1 hypothetical protein [Hymenobacter sp. CA2-7]
MRVLLLLFFAAVDYYVVFVFFREKNRRNAFTSLAWLIGAVLFSKISSLLLGATRSYPENVRPSTLFSVLLIFSIAFFIQLIARFANQVPGWHREQPKVILQEVLPTYFFFVISLLMLWGVWLGPTGRTL